MPAGLTLPPLTLDCPERHPPSTTAPPTITPSNPPPLTTPSTSPIPSTPTLYPNPQPLGSPHSLGRRRLDAFHIVCLIGKGGFGQVFMVRHKATSAIYAMKVMDKDALINRRAVDDAHTERNILAMLGSTQVDTPPFIVRLHVAFQTARRVYLVMDFASGGELMFHLRREAMLGEDDARFYAAELLVALEALHERDVVHRDIKPENVLLDGEGHVVLTDFGLAKELSGPQEQTHSWCGSDDYMAPEIIARAQHTGKPADYWAFGVFLYDCLCGQPPFSPLHERGKLSRKRLHERILKQKVRLPPFLSPECHSLLRKLLTKDARKRLTDPVAIRQHAWFANIDWEALRKKEVVPPIVPAESSPTACFSPTLTKAPLPLARVDETAPLSPMGTWIGSPRVNGGGGAQGLHQQQQQQQQGQQQTGTAPIAVASRKSSGGGVGGCSADNIWKGFSFVAPGMEVHFELAAPAPTVPAPTLVPAPLALGAAAFVGSPDVGSGSLAGGESCEWEEALIAEFEDEAKEAVEIVEADTDELKS